MTNEDKRRKEALLLGEIISERQLESAFPELEIATEVAVDDGGMETSVEDVQRAFEHEWGLTLTDHVDIIKGEL